MPVQFWPYGSKQSEAYGKEAHIAQTVEHFLGKEEVTGSSPVVGSSDTNVLNHRFTMLRLPDTASGAPQIASSHVQARLALKALTFRSSALCFQHSTVASEKRMICGERSSNVAGKTLTVWLKWSLTKTAFNRGYVAFGKEASEHRRQRI